MSRKTRKLIWSAPLVAVLAVVGALAIFAAMTPGGVFAHDLPGVVGNLTGEADGTNAIDLSWDAPTEGGTPTGYRIDRSPNGNTWMSLAMGHTARTYGDTGLKPGTSYYYRVFAVNAVGVGPVSQDYQVQTDVGTAPGATISLRATAMGQNQVNLSWSVPTILGGSPVTKYSIHWAASTDAIPAATETATDDNVMDVNAEDGTSLEHKELTAETRYQYIVYAHNATGKSMIASDIAAATTDSLDRPGAPTGVTAVQTDTRGFTLYWYAPTSTGGAPITSYRVQVAYNNYGYIAAPVGVTVNPASGTAGNSTPTAQATFANVPEAYDHDDDVATTAVDITSVRLRVYSQTGDHTSEPATGLESSSGATGSRMTILPQVGTPTSGDRANLIPDAVDGDDIDAMRDPFKNVDLEWGSSRHQQRQHRSRFHRRLSHRCFGRRVRLACLDSPHRENGS